MVSRSYDENAPDGSFWMKHRKLSSVRVASAEDSTDYALWKLTSSRLTRGERASDAWGDGTSWVRCSNNGRLDIRAEWAVCYRVG